MNRNKPLIIPKFKWKKEPYPASFVGVTEQVFEPKDYKNTPTIANFNDSPYMNGGNCFNGSDTQFAADQTGFAIVPESKRGGSAVDIIAGRLWEPTGYWGKKNTPIKVAKLINIKLSYNGISNRPSFAHFAQPTTFATLTALANDLDCSIYVSRAVDEHSITYHDLLFGIPPVKLIYPDGLTDQYIETRFDTGFPVHGGKQLNVKVNAGTRFTNQSYCAVWTDTSFDPGFSGTRIYTGTIYQTNYPTLVTGGTFLFGGTYYRQRVMYDTVRLLADSAKLMTYANNFEKLNYLVLDDDYQYEAITSLSIDPGLTPLQLHNLTYALCPLVARSRFDGSTTDFINKLRDYATTFFQ